MPEHTSWFNLLPFFQSFQDWLSNTLGPTWIEHTKTLKVQHLFGSALVLLVLLWIGTGIRAWHVTWRVDASAAEYA